MKSVADFSERFAELIDGNSFTKIGEEIGMSKQTISAYVNGVRKPKKPTINAIANQYGVNPLWLIGYDVPKYSVNAPQKTEKAPGVSAEGIAKINAILAELSPENQEKLLELARLYLDAQNKQEGKK